MTSEPISRTGAGPSRVALSEISTLLQEAADLSADRGAPLSRRVAFHLRKAELFEQLADDEPGNADRQAAAMQARRQYEHYLAMAERVTA
jgi:predicted outer membrane protein